MPKKRNKRRTYVRPAPEVMGQPPAVEVVEVCEDCQPRIHRVIRRLNIARPICDFMLGENHPTAHRFAIGTIIMAIGVTIAKSGGHLPNAVLAHFFDLLGYSLHGFGLTPFIEHAVEKVREAKRAAEMEVHTLRSEVQRE